MIKVFIHEIEKQIASNRTLYNQTNFEIFNERLQKLESLMDEIITQYTAKLIYYVYVDSYIEASLTHKTVSEYKVKERIDAALHQYLDKLQGGDVIDYERINNIIK